MWSHRQDGPGLPKPRLSQRGLCCPPLAASSGPGQVGWPVTVLWEGQARPHRVPGDAGAAGSSSPGGLALTLYPVLLHLLHFRNGLPQIIGELLPVLWVGSVKVY